MKQLYMLKRKMTVLFITVLLGLNVNAQDLQLNSNEIQKLKTQLDAGSFLIGYGLSNGSSIEAGYNFIFGFNGDDDLIWNKISLKAGYSPALSKDIYSLSAGFARTRNFIAYRADLATSFSDGNTNVSIHPKIGVDLILVELYIGYNQYFKKNIPGLENQVTFSANINFGWTGLIKRSVIQTIKSL